jgi:signal transduction histidine kinase
LHNLLKHSRATAVEISVSRRDNEFQFRIADNGGGFDAGKKSSGNGLQNMKRRAAEIGGRLEIESGGGGTILTLTAPITQTRGWW